MPRSRNPFDEPPLAAGSTLNLNPFLYKELPFDPLRSFTPVTLTARTNFILVVHPKLGVDTLERLEPIVKRTGARLE